MFVLLFVSVCVCVWQRALKAHGVQTASTHATVTMGPSAAPQMGSATAALDGPDCTVLSVGLTHTHTDTHKHTQMRCSLTLCLE